MKVLTKDDIDLSHWEFEFQQRGEQPILLCDFFCRSLDEFLIKEVLGTPEHCDYLFTDSDKGYIHPAHRARVSALLNQLAHNPQAVAKFLIDSIEVPRGFNAVADVVTKEVQETSTTNNRLAELWRAMDSYFLQVVPWFYYPWYVSKENVLTDRIKEHLERYRTDIETICDFDEALLALVFPIKKTGFQLEQEEMLKLVTIADTKSNFAEDTEFKTAAQEYLRKFDWLTTFILTPLLPMTYEQLVERVERALEESFVETFTLQQKATRENEEKAIHLLKLLKNDPELIARIVDARELGYVLTAGVEEAYIASARYLPFMQLVATRIGVAFDDLKRLTTDEIIAALTSGATIPESTIQERRQGFVMMMRNGMQSATYGQDAHALSVWIDAELNKVDQEITELKGQVASKGQATGKVRLATTPQQAHTLLEGEILVCPMTNPDYVPAMRRSGAIVTDEGGLLSHAAIMSREFGKPCVIGTKIATQLLKDGDLIEVDALAGTVRIVARA